VADRKRKTQQAIQESVEIAEQATKSPKPSTTPTTPTTAGYSISDKERAEAEAPLHPRAAKSLGYRRRELLTGLIAAQAADARKLAEYKAVRDKSRTLPTPSSIDYKTPEAPGGGGTPKADEGTGTTATRKTKGGKVISKPISAGGKPKKSNTVRTTKSNVSTSTTKDRLSEIDAQMKHKQSRASDFNKRLK
jgi:hypothetical protein